MFDQRGQNVNKQYNAGRDININVTSPLGPREKRNRRRMLQKVGDFWIKGVLENSLHGAALIELGMEYKPDAVQHPWDMVIQQPHQPTRSIPPRTKIIDVFDEVGGELLILGAPGSGKTTMLLELARDLIGRAELDETYPMPVVFNLASWAEKHKPLVEWLVDELNTRYDVPSKTGRVWIDSDNVLPMLDGLDEVQEQLRGACVEAINGYRKEHGGLIPLVVCSRAVDYEALTKKLHVQAAVVIQPLMKHQLDAYLERAGEKLAGLRAGLHHDADLVCLLDTPLMLTIAVLAYADTLAVGVDVQSARTVIDRRKHLFDAYIEAVFQRRNDEPIYRPDQTAQQLSWLAREMVQRTQSIFFIERLQPNWLSINMLLWQYLLLDRLFTAIIAALSFGLGFGTFSILLFMLQIKSISGLTNVFYPTLMSAWNIGIIGASPGLIIGGLFGGLFGGKFTPKTELYTNIKLQIKNGVLGMLVVGLAACLIAVFHPANTTDLPSIYSIDRDTIDISHYFISTINNERNQYFNRKNIPASNQMYQIRLLPSYTFTAVQQNNPDRKITVKPDFNANIETFINNVAINVNSSDWGCAVLKGERLEIWSCIQGYTSIYTRELPSNSIFLSPKWTDKFVKYSDNINLGNSSFSFIFSIIGALFGISFGLLAGSPGYQPRQIELHETLYISQKRALLVGTITLIINLTFLLIYLVILSPQSREDVDLQVGGMVGAILLALCIGLLSALSSGEIEIKTKSNEGIRRSFRSSLLGGTTFGLVVGLVIGGLFGLLFGANSGLLAGLSLGLVFGSIGAFIYGGYTCVSHFALRLTLKFNGILVFNLVPFLDYCVDRIFLRKVGGGYIFIHRLLMEYFASLDDAQIEALSARANKTR